MCYRIFLEVYRDDLEEDFEIASASPLVSRFAERGSVLKTYGDIFPSDVVPVLAPGKDRHVSAFPMKWGFTVPGRPVLANARSETASEKPTFRDLWKSRRCLIPASGYYEWEHFVDSSGKRKTGDRYLIAPPKDRRIWIAGLYRIEDSLPVFTVLTRQATPELGKIHDRMPLMFYPELKDDWIDPDGDPRRLLRYAVTDLEARVDRKAKE